MVGSSIWTYSLDIARIPDSEVALSHDHRRLYLSLSSNHDKPGGHAKQRAVSKYQAM